MSLLAAFHARFFGFFVFALFAFCLTGCKTTGAGAPGKALNATVSTLAGSTEGFADGAGSKAQFHRPFGLAMDKAGNLYVADSRNSRIRKVSPQGETSTFAGGESGFADGKGGEAKFEGPADIAMDAKGNLYVTDYEGNHIRKISPEGEVSTLAGSGESGFADGTGSEAKFNTPVGIVLDKAGNLYVADGGNNRIRKVSPKGEVSTLAGGEEGFADGTGSQAQFHYPLGLAIDAAGNLYVADTENNRIRKVSPKGEVSTLAGSGERGFADGTGSEAEFDRPGGLAVGAKGVLYVADSGNHRLRRVFNGEVSTFAGSGEGAFADGTGSAAGFHFPAGMAVDSAGNLYVADYENHRIRKVVLEGARP